MTLSRRLLSQKAHDYDEFEGLSDEERRRLETLPLAFEEGTWTWEDLEWIIGWKMTDMPFEQKVLDDFNSNDEAFVTSQIQKVLVARNPGEKLDLLTDINGVAERMGSAFLLFMDPKMYTVLDWRAWGVLHETGYLPHQMPDDPSVDDYLIYLGACWALANEYDVSLRTLDMALWALRSED